MSKKQKNSLIIWLIILFLLILFGSLIPKVATSWVGNIYEQYDYYDILSVIRCRDFSGNRLLACQKSVENKLSKQEWLYWDELIFRESGYNHLAVNKTSGAFGLPQALPASKIAEFGNILDPETQLDWMWHYITNRYGSALEAIIWHNKHNYY